MPKAEFDQQMRYLWHLVKLAGWDAKHCTLPCSRFDAYILRTFKATHMKALTPEEIRRAIATMKPYAEKAKGERAKKMRQSIMAYVAKNHKDKEWLHDNMVTWGYGLSLRALQIDALAKVFQCVRECFEPNNIPNKGGHNG